MFLCFCFTASFLIVFGPRHLALCAVPYISALMRQWATLAAALIEPRTDSLPGGSVFHSTGPPSHRLSILPTQPTNRIPHKHVPDSPPTLYITAHETPRKDFLPKHMGDKVPLPAKERKWDPPTWRRVGGVREIYYGTHSVVAVWRKIYCGYRMMYFEEPRLKYATRATKMI